MPNYVIQLGAPPLELRLLSFRQVFKACGAVCLDVFRNRAAITVRLQLLVALMTYNLSVGGPASEASRSRAGLNL